MPKLARPLPLLVLLGLLSTSPLSLEAQAGEVYLYRYLNPEGNTVINSVIPPEFVHGGYEVLKLNGTVYKVVPRAPTPEERANRSDEALREIADKEQAKRLAKWDKSLLLRYSNMEDIVAARDRSLSELRIRISILRSNVRSLTLQVESSQARAADVERRGGTVPVEMVSAINALRDEIKETERSVAERVEETEVVAQGFERDMGRFAVVLANLEQRKKISKASN
jgi:hypothetical protein